MKRCNDRHTLGLATLCCFLAGCGFWGSDPVHSRLQALSSLNQSFIVANRRPPASEQELRDFAASHGAEILSKFQIPDVDTLFISERDNQPFTIQFGKDLARTNIFAYEQQGRDGERMVAFAGGHVQLLTDAVFHQVLTDG